MFNHQAGFKPVYWLMLANCCFSYGRCCCHSFLWQMFFATVLYFWQMLLPYSCWLMLLPQCLVGGRCCCHCGCCLCHLWECCIFCGRCYCNLCWLMLLPYLLLCLWQMLWPLWLMVLPLIRLM